MRKASTHCTMSESRVAHKYLDGLRGIEIGGSAHNSFGIKGCINIDYAKDAENNDPKSNRMKVDVVARGEVLPFADDSLGYVLSSHVLEHCYDVIGTLKEWMRVVRPGGYIVFVVPHKERTFDKDRDRTPLLDLIGRHNGTIDSPDRDKPDIHHSVWITADILQLAIYLKYKIVTFLDVDDKVGNGALFVLQKT